MRQYIRIDIYFEKKKIKYKVDLEAGREFHKQVVREKIT